MHESVTHFYEHEAEGTDHLVITLPFPSSHCASQQGLWRTDTNHDITKVGNRLSEQSAAAVLVGISHSTNSVGLPTTASGGFIYYLHRAVRRVSAARLAVGENFFPRFVAVGLLVCCKNPLQLWIDFKGNLQARMLYGA